MVIKNFFIGILIIVKIAFGNAQEVLRTPSSLVFSGYIETYFSYDFANPGNHVRPEFVYSHNKHNELNLNLGVAKVFYEHKNVHANLAIMAGTYPEYNMANEQNLLKNVFEANVGVKISAKHNLWVDAGIMPSHIGFESAIGKDCANVTRSILADNSPYYEAGVKIGYTTLSKRWYMAALYLNGWQRIKKIEGNQTPAFGTQVTYKPSVKTTLNWSTYFGNEQPDSDRKYRFFNNLFGQFVLSDQLNVTVGLDVGFQQATYKSQKYDTWFSPILILQYKPTTTVQLAARGEYYEDEKGVIIGFTNPNGFKTFGFSTNFDYLVANNVMFRIEARKLFSNNNVFITNGAAANINTFITTSLAVSF